MDRYHDSVENWEFGKLSAMQEIALTVEGGYGYYYMGTLPAGPIAALRTLWVDGCYQAIISILASRCGIKAPSAQPTC